MLTTLALRVIALELIIPMALAAQVFVVNQNVQKQEAAIDQAKLEKVEQLTALLNKYDSPLVDQAETFVVVADNYGLDWKLLPAITGIESSFGKYTLEGSYNPFGWGGGYIYFDSWEDGIETVAQGLAQNYQAATRTVEEIAPTYCPPNWKNWIAGVRKFMSELEELA